MNANVRQSHNACSKCRGVQNAIPRPLQAILLDAVFIASRNRKGTATRCARMHPDRSP